MIDRVWEETVLTILRYLDGNEKEERIAPSLESFLKAAARRAERWRAPFAQLTQRELFLLTESWLVSNPNAQPLWPKDYEPERAFWHNRGPEWMKRRWI